MDYTMLFAKKDLQAGYLTGYQIDRVSMEYGWTITLRAWGTTKSRAATGWLVDARTKKSRVFKTLDAAVKALEQIGFKVDSLEMSGNHHVDGK